MTGAQIGKTLIMTFLIGYHVDQDPATMLVVFPTLDAAEAFSKEKLTPFLRETPCLAEKTMDPRSRDSGNTLLTKSFTSGAHLAIAGANSPTSLASRSRRILLCDEVDKYEASAGTEGDPVNLARKRLRTYWNRKEILCSTPNIAGRSRIAKAYDSTDKRRYYVPCQYCGEEQVLLWSQVGYEEGEKRVDEDGHEHRTAERAWYECEHCAAHWTEADRLKSVANGRWVATAPLKDGKVGFHISAIASSFVSLQELASEWLDAQGKPEELKTFVNANLGETWRERGDAPEWKRIFDRVDRSRQIGGLVPAGVLFLTAGADVQEDRIEVQVIGWGRGKQSWLADYIVLEGDPSRKEVWRQLTAVLGTMYQHESGVDLPIRKFAIDSGYATQFVYDWAREHKFGPVAVVKGGSDTTAAPVSAPSPVEVTVGGKRLQTGIKVHVLNVGHFKSELYGRLRLELPNVEKGEAYPDGFVHLCALPDTEEYCKQLTAEQIITRTHRGFQKREWEKTRPRNEALDTWVYARAAAAMIGMDRFREWDWTSLDAQLGASARSQALATASPVAQPVEPLSSPRSEGGWFGNRRGSWFQR